MAMSNTIGTYKRDGKRIVLTGRNPILWLFVPLYLFIKVAMIVFALLAIMCHISFVGQWLDAEHPFKLASALFAVSWIVRIPLTFTKVERCFGNDMNMAQRIDNFFGCYTMYGLFGISAIALIGVGMFIVHLAIMPHISMFMIVDAIFALFGHSQRSFWLTAFFEFGYYKTFGLAIISPIFFGIAWLYAGWRIVMEWKFRD